MKYFSPFLIVTLLFTCFSCKQTSTIDNIIMVTIEPQRYFTEQLTDSLFKIETMVPAGSSPETFDPSPNQMLLLANCKAYFFVGNLGFEEVWLNKLQSNFPSVRFFNTSKNIRPCITFIDHGDHRHEGVDPHTWSSPKSAAIIVQNMFEALAEIDPENTILYRSNLEKLQKRISEIDREVQDILSRSSQKAFIIYHPALTYFARDYGLTQYCIETDGKEPSPEQLKSLVQTTREKDIKTIFIQEEFDRKNAETISKETGCRLVVINPLSYNWPEETLKIAKALSDE